MVAARRILHVIETPGTGGAERILVDVAKGLSENFISSGLMLVNGWTADQLRACGVRVDILSLQKSFDLGWPLRLAAYLRRKKIDVVHAHEFTATVYAAMGCLLAGVPLISTMHGKNYWPKRRYRRIALRWAAGRANAFVTVSRDLQAFASSTLDIELEKIRVVANGIDMDKFLPDKSARTRIRAAMNVSEETPVLACIGALEPVKAHDLLLRAMARLLRHEINAQLWIIGEGYLQEQLENQGANLNLKSNVRFLGWRDDIRDLLMAADITVLCSHSEGMPLAVLESMACGRPVVATNVGGVPEIIDHRINGLIVPTDNEEALASALNDLISNKSLRSEMSEAALKKAREKFSLRNMCETYQAIYAEASPGNK